ncbi:hypothetical protein [Candidatus Berkiella aquae]|uniref:Kazal-like domain-containing protein n=1 Tax=Candidatus Berkiella aquae TaxID=295108 RepID=A0A0Q9YIP4_9GAMM|nr:hypothetical protein [Candidatus Berkiella aquae]MCS5712205.1 hypothetical protein [Candidatus Berkiella aquae]
MRRVIMSLAVALTAVTGATAAQAGCCEIGKPHYRWNKCIPDYYQCCEHKNGYFYAQCGKCKIPDYQYTRVMRHAECPYGLCHKCSHYRGFYRVYNHEGLSYEIYTR